MPMNPAAAVTWGSFVQAAYDQYASDPGQANPAAIMNMPAGYTLVRTIQMTDFLGPVRSRVFYGFVAAGGDPRTAVVALRGTVCAAEWWDDLHWDLVPFTQVPDGGKVARGFLDIYSTYGTMTPGQQQGARASATFAADVAQAAASGLQAGLDPALPAVVCGHSLGGALATLLVADLTANTPLKPQAWTFASPRVGDADFAGRYGGLSTVSWRIYNQADVVPYFPVDAAGSYQPVTAGYAINSLGKAKWSLRCAHALSTYLHVLSPGTVPLNQACTLAIWQPATAPPRSTAGRRSYRSTHQPGYRGPIARTPRLACSCMTARHRKRIVIPQTGRHLGLLWLWPHPGVSAETLAYAASRAVISGRDAAAGWSACLGLTGRARTSAQGVGGRKGPVPQRTWRKKA